MRYNEKRAGKFGKRAQLWVFHSKCPKFTAFGMLHPLNGMWFQRFFSENKLFHLSKRALRAGTARNKWLKEPLASKCFSHITK